MAPSPERQQRPRSPAESAATSSSAGGCGGGAGGGTGRGLRGRSEVGNPENDEPVTRLRFSIPAYYCNRSLPRSRSRPAPSEEHWARHPSDAAELHAPVLFQHQALPCKNTPHVFEGASQRWPNTSLPAGSGLPESLDDRRHSHWFGYRELRWRKPWALLNAEEPREIPVLTLDDIKLFLTARHGSLKVAFEKLDFFEDRRLSVVEWQDGLFNLFTTANDKKFSRYRACCQPRAAFNERMRKLFAMMDKDNDGLISFEELTRDHFEPGETARQFTLRKNREHVAGKETGFEFLKRTDTLGRLDLAEIAGEPGCDEEEYDLAQDYGGDSDSLSTGSSQETSTAGVKPPSDLLRDFASVLIKSYPNIKAAFKSFDDSNNGQLSMSEFVGGAKNKLRFAGDLRAVFKELDTSRNGVISVSEFTVLRQLGRRDRCVGDDMILKTRKDVVSARRMRSPITGPAKLERGECLDSHNLGRRFGERVSSSAGFYSFPRSATGRVDPVLHPCEIPGVDPELFSQGHGPGSFEKGPGHHAESGCSQHPLRGSGWKKGAALSKAARFGHLLPTKSGLESAACMDASFCTYEGRAADGGESASKINGIGAVSMRNSTHRLGHTFGNDSCLLRPKPGGPWAESRLGTRLLSTGSASLLRTSC
eukprot:TRINITY_DN62988_c0_g1_i1.p1 TRINITY_DN62988_c0_g1~~TRINITY_DN62988_c0_g1_i1.p1  ORF type:complete len:665 (+),score=68.90 TRINITY_DN62988_c0_g1_i1:51-1997(+)